VTAPLPEIVFTLGFLVSSLHFPLFVSSSFLIWDLGCDFCFWGACQEVFENPSQTAARAVGPFFSARERPPFPSGAFFTKRFFFFFSAALPQKFCGGGLPLRIGFLFSYFWTFEGILFPVHTLNPFFFFFLCLMDSPRSSPPGSGVPPWLCSRPFSVIDARIRWQNLLDFW